MYLSSNRPQPSVVSKKKTEKLTKSVAQTPPVRTYGRLASFAEGVVGVSLHEAGFADTPGAYDDDLEFKISGPGWYLLTARLSSEGRG